MAIYCNALAKGNLKWVWLLALLTVWASCKKDQVDCTGNDPCQIEKVYEEYNESGPSHVQKYTNYYTYKNGKISQIQKGDGTNLYYEYNAEGYLQLVLSASSYTKTYTATYYQYDYANNQYFGYDMVAATPPDTGQVLINKKIYTYANGELLRIDYYNKTNDTLVSTVSYRDYVNGNCTYSEAHNYKNNADIYAYYQYGTDKLASFYPMDFPAATSINNIASNDDSLYQGKHVHSTIYNSNGCMESYGDEIVGSPNYHNYRAVFACQ